MTLDRQQVATNEDALKDRHILTGTLFRGRSSRVMLSETPPSPKPEPVRRPAKVPRMLALAHHLQSVIDRGLVADRATVARRLGFTRGRVMQLLDLTLLAPDIQERVLELETVDRAEPMSERGLRHLIRAGPCQAQHQQPGDSFPADVDAASFPLFRALSEHPMELSFAFGSES